MSSVRSNKVFTGTNAERLVLATSDLEHGDSWLETDTCSEYMWSGELGSWYQTRKTGATAMYDADANTTIVNEYFNNPSGIATTLASAATIGDTLISVVNATGFSVGDTISVENGFVEASFPTITAIVTNDITLDQPLDNSYVAGDDVIVLDVNMNVVGSLASPISFKITPERGETWHIIRLLLDMVHAAAADDSKFGSISALTNGCVVRGFISGQFRTLTNWKTNSDIKLDMFDLIYTDKAGSGAFGTNGRGSIKIGTGAVPKLVPTADYLEILIQDDLSGLTSFRVKAQGHVN